MGANESRGQAMRRLVGVATAATATVFIGVAANAADVVQIVPTVQPTVVAEEPANVAAMVEVFGGFAHMGLGNVNDAGCQGCHDTGVGFGGEGRAALKISPSLSMQLNVWAEHWSGQSTFEGFACDGPCNEPWYVNRMGVGTHLIYDAGNFQVGGFASVGTRSAEGIFIGFPPATYGNFGLEAAFNADRFRLYGQAGYTIPVAPSFIRDYWASNGMKEFYGRLVGTFYPNPNVALSANVGMEVVAGTAPWLPSRALIWGAEAQFQLSGKPLYFLASYQGSLGLNADGYQIVGNVIRLGIGLNVGSPDLQTRDRALGFADYNCTFGIRSTPACLIGGGGG
jgi:hypothetical protein